MQRIPKGGGGVRMSRGRAAQSVPEGFGQELAPQTHREAVSVSFPVVARSVRRRALTVLLFSALALPPTITWAQAITPPNAFHPYRGSTNCLQVADRQGFFNCAPGTTVDPTTGNMVVGGTLAFQGLAAGTFNNGLALAAVGSGVQLLGAGDLVISTSPKSIAPSGPMIRGVVFRVRAAGPGLCQVVVSGGNGFKEYVVPVFAEPSFLSQSQERLWATFPGGPSGC